MSNTFDQPSGPRLTPQQAQALRAGLLALAGARKGGRARTTAKLAASRTNGLRGGRPAGKARSPQRTAVFDYSTGNLLDSGADALVNPINCVGVMGKGLALAFAQRYPAMLAAYRSACTRNEIRLGAIWPWRAETQWILGFPTKTHWRLPSQLTDIEKGLSALARFLRQHPSIHSIAVPALGCGLGGLAWDTVHPLILAKLGSVPHLRVVIYPPQPARAPTAGLGLTALAGKAPTAPPAGTGQTQLPVGPGGRL